MIKKADIAQYFDFPDTERAFIADQMVDVPKLTEANFMYLIDEHNLLVYEFAKFKQQAKQDLNEVKENTK